MMKRGFTLVELLIALVIISVGMLALGSFYTSMIMQESVAQERIAAVHIAEQLIEDWELNDALAAPVLPTPNCLVGGVAVTLVLGTATQNCVSPAAQGTPISYTILLTETPAKAPLPVSHPNNPSLIVVNSTGVGMYPMLTLSDVNKNIIANSPPVMVRSAKVSWTHDKTQTVQLTHITRYMP